MEIERKFLLPDFPDLPVAVSLDQWQGYLCTEPEVRIRRTINHTGGTLNHILCIKSKGDLVRHEVETSITPDQFDELAAMLQHPLIHKQMKIYHLDDGNMIECSRVDDGVFCYAEVEFPTREQALAWTPLPWLGRELTYDRSFKMSSYWSDRSLPSHLNTKV